VNQQKEVREKRRDEFLYSFTGNGKFLELKNSMKNSIVDLLKD